jgi:uncharacterized protein
LIRPRQEASGPAAPVSARDFTANDAAPLLRVNAGARPHVAALDGADLTRLRELGAIVLVANCAGEVAGYLIAFLDAAPYDGEEFRRFQRQLGRPFLYIDQVAVSSAFRMRGVARALYEAVATHPRVPASTRRCCEVNIDPPNPGSLDFHLRMGFERTADMSVTDGRTVALLVERAEGR